MITRIRKMNQDFQTLITSRYPNEFKKKVILYAERHNNSEAERVFGIAESNIRRWRKLRPLIFSKSFEMSRKKRLAKKVAANNDDFIYEIEKLDNMLGTSGNRLKTLLPKDHSRISKGDAVTRKKFLTSPPTLSPISPPKNKEIKADSDTEEVCLRWNSHHNNMKSTFPALLQREQYVDVTLTSEGKSIKCHRLILSSCSAYFEELLNGISPLQHPVIFLTGVPFWVLKCLIDFMYAGEVHIEQNRLEALLKVAEMLQIKGLNGKTNQAQSEERKVTTTPSPTPIKTERAPSEPKIPQTKKEIPSTSTTTVKSPMKKVLSPTLSSTIDPLSLLEPTFFEETPVPLRFKEHGGSSTKKVVSKKIKKRKLSEHEPSPPPMLYRKGTKSRPHVKIPRYYHNDFDGLEGKKLTRKDDSASSISDLPELSDIKIESLIIEQVDDHQNGDKRRSSKQQQISTKASSSKKQLSNADRKVDDLSETSLNDRVEDANETDFVDVLAKEIKQEEIDLDYTDLSNSEDHNATI